MPNGSPGEPTLPAPSVLKKKPVQLVSVENPEGYKGEEIEIASDELDFGRIRAILRRETGKFQPYVRVPSAVATSLTGEIGEMFRWFRDHVYDADMEQMKRLNPGLVTFEQWAKKSAAA